MIEERETTDSLFEKGQKFEESLIRFREILEENFSSLPTSSENLTFLQDAVAEYAKKSFEAVGDDLVNTEELFIELYQGVIWGPHDSGKTVFFSWTSENDIIAETEQGSGVGSIQWNKENLINGIIGVFSVNKGAII